MKVRNLFAAAMIAVLAFTSCSQDDDVTTNDPNIVRFDASIEGQNLKAHFDSDGSGGFDSGDMWGIYAKTGTNSFTLANEKYTPGESILYWQDISPNNTPVTFSAYYPTLLSPAIISDSTAYKFNVANAFLSDLLLTGPVTASKGEDVKFNFKHVMHRLSFQFSKEGGVPGNLDDIEFSLLNMKSTAHVNILEGTVDPTLAEGTTDYPKYVYWEQPCVAPQDLTAGADWIEIRLEGKTYTAKVPPALNPNNPGHPTRLESGKKLVVQLTLKQDPGSGKTAVAMSTAQISAWINQGTLSTNADE